jgi:hypothetical protein
MTAVSPALLTSCCCCCCCCSSPSPCPQEFDANYDGRISFDEFNTALGRWVDEKLATSSSSSAAAAAAAGGGVGGFGGRYSSLLDPSAGGPAASLLEDLPPDDLAALQVGSRGVEVGVCACFGDWWCSDGTQAGIRHQQAVL